MRVDANTIRAICIGKPNEANMNAVLIALNQHGDKFGMLQPHRLAQFLPQVLHESAEFRYDREVWGPTPAQQRYEDRADLGHSAAVDNEAFMFRGKTAIQVTGRANHAEYRDWCRRYVSANAPDFEANPDAMLTDPWEGLAPIWYWTTRNLNRYADQGDIEMITKRINGGLNGYADRLMYYTRTALVFLGYSPTDVRGFQRARGLDVDGIAGPKTRSAMHKALAAMAGASVPSAPVTQPEPVAPEQIDKPVTQTTGFWERLTQIVGLSGIGGVAAFLQDWRVIVAIAFALIVVAIVGLLLHKRIIDAVRNIKSELVK